MSVIIRLQNLPWSANAFDIRQFFKGLSIPEGGVHIVGGEMGDAFIAFSTDEDARQAMMHDREKINEVQVRLLLSSRAEMQKVIETARQQSILAQQNTTKAIATAQTASSPVAAVAAAATATPIPQPPVITANSLQNILSNTLSTPPSFLTYQQQAGITLNEKSPIVSDNANATASHRNSVESIGRDRRRSTSRDRRRSRSRERGGDRVSSTSSSFRRRRDRSRSRSRERDHKGRRFRRSRSRERSRERDRPRNTNRNSRSSKDRDLGPGSRKDINTKSNPLTNDTTNAKGKAAPIMPWSVPITNAYQTDFNAQQSNNNNKPNVNPNVFAVGNNSNNSNTGVRSLHNPFNPDRGNIPPVLPAFQSFSSSTSTTNNYSINIFGNKKPNNATNGSNNEPLKPFAALQNPYTTSLLNASNNSNSQDSSNAPQSPSSNVAQTGTMFPGLFLDQKLETLQQQQQQLLAAAAAASTLSSLQQQLQQQKQQQQQDQEPIAFANTNPYAQMYPNLFAQATSIGNLNKQQQQQQQQQKTDQSSSGSGLDYKNDSKQHESDNSCSIKMTSMCPSVTYSDLRKFFSGLFIPHNGIKMVNDKHGERIGTAYVQFSRSSSVQKALARGNDQLKGKPLKIELCSDEDFDNISDNYRPLNRYDHRDDGWRDDNTSNTGDKEASNKQQQSQNREPFNVLYIDDIPSFATEQDIMKMFSAFTIIDILLTPSPENRRVFIAHVKFSRHEDAKSALEDRSRHVIGYRKVRVRAGRTEDMDRAKEKLRLANEQLKKEEQALLAEQMAKEETINIDESQDENVDMLLSSPQDEHDNNDNDDKQNIQNEEEEQRRDPDEGDNNDNISNMNQFGGPADPRLRRHNPFVKNNNNNNFSNNNNNPNNNNNNNHNNNGNNHNFNNDHNNQQHNNNNNNNSNNIPLHILQMLSQTIANGGNMSGGGGGMGDFNGPVFSPRNNPGEACFVILKNCDYNTRINEVGNLFMSSNLAVKHVELLRNERKMPTGEFIVEFANPEDADIAVNDFNNTQFRLRNLRVRSITPQEIADRLHKPFMNYFPGGMGRRPDFMGPMGGGPNNMFDGGRMGGGGGGGGSGGRRGNMFGGPGPMRSDFGGRHNNNNNNNNTNNMRFRGRRDDMNDGDSNNIDDMMMDDGNNDNDMGCFMNGDDNDMINDDNDNNGGGGRGGGGGGGGNGNSDAIPEKFNRPGCVIAMQNVPFKADLKMIMRFFSGYNLTPDDIIRRFNDDGSPTGDARVAFESPEEALDALNMKRPRRMLNRSIQLSLL